MIYTIPCAPGGDARWSQQTALDGVTFNLAFDWNDRGGFWTLSIADALSAPIRTGVVLVVCRPLLWGVTDPRRPRGELIVADAQDRNDIDPGFSDLGARFRLLYLAAEVAR